MRKLVDRLFADYGTDGQLEKGDTRTAVRVFFQVQRLHKLQRVLTPLGELHQGQYICYFPAEVPVEVGDSLILQGNRYRIHRCEALAGPGGQVWYHWALCLGREAA